MEPALEKILIMDADPSSRTNLEGLLQGAGYEVLTAETCHEGLESARNNKVDLMILDAGLPGLISSDLVAELKGASVTEGIRVIVVDPGGPSERVRDLDMGADDALSRPWHPVEMLSRVRLQLRAKKAQDNLRRRVALAEEDDELTRTAFHALAVTEKMTRDAFSLGRGLKLGVAALLVMAGIMALIYFRFSRRATTETQISYAAIARLNLGLTRQEDLIAQSRKISQQMQSLADGPTPTNKQKLEQKSQQLRAQLATASSPEAANLRGQLNQTEARLRQIESGGSVAQGIIRTYAPSVCLLHLAVAFREQSGQRYLRYFGLTGDGEPITDAKENPILTLEGTGPEVLVHVFGTGFVAAPGGHLITNHHVVEPWWNNDELSSLTQQGMVPVISKMEAYFPGLPHSFEAVTERISSEADVAEVRVNLGNSKREVLAVDAHRDASVSGQPVVLMGYPTGIEAILARADDSTVKDIVTSSRGDLNAIVVELARRNLIRPIVTQGHIGDVLPDKVVYDAQTTSGGSGGPLFNQDGKVIGINYAVVRDFGGSNFGIPVRYAEALLPH